MKQFRTTLGNLRKGHVLPGWEDTWAGFADETPVIVYPEGSMKVGDSDLMPLPFEAYGNTSSENWEDLPWENPQY